MVTLRDYSLALLSDSSSAGFLAAIVNTSPLSGRWFGSAFPVVSFRHTSAVAALLKQSDFCNNS